MSINFASRRIILVSVIALIATFISYGQDKPVPTSGSGDLAAQSQNPIASLISVPFQFNFNFGVGEFDRTQTILNVQPVLPAKVGKKWNMINRIILPIMIQPDVNASSGETFGLGAINYTAFFSPEPIGKTSIGFGPSLLIPVNTSSKLGNSQFAIGPSVVLFTGVGKWTLGFVAAQNWGYLSPNESPLQNSFFTQYFVNRNFNKGWSVGMAPTITVNWKADKGEKAVVPFGLNVAKLTKLGKSQPAKFILGYYYNAVRPDSGPKGGQLQFMMVLLFPK
jgi:hypothetical protein